MASPEAYGSGDFPVDRIETHASVVFLAGTVAYKIKRAVKYPFLDFSTLEKRHRALVNELAHQPTYRTSALSRCDPDNCRRKRWISPWRRGRRHRMGTRHAPVRSGEALRPHGGGGASAALCHAAACTGDRRLSSRGELLPRAGDKRGGVARGAQGQRDGTCRREGRLSRRCTRHRQSWKPRGARGACPPASGARQRRLCAALSRRSASPQHRRDRRRASVVRRHRIR